MNNKNVYILVCFSQKAIIWLKRTWNIVVNLNRVLRYFCGTFKAPVHFQIKSVTAILFWISPFVFHRCRKVIRVWWSIPFFFSSFFADFHIDKELGVFLLQGKGRSQELKRLLSGCSPVLSPLTVKGSISELQHHEMVNEKRMEASHWEIFWQWTDLLQPNHCEHPLHWSLPPPSHTGQQVPLRSWTEISVIIWNSQNVIQLSTLVNYGIQTEEALWLCLLWIFVWKNNADCIKFIQLQQQTQCPLLHLLIYSVLKGEAFNFCVPSY